jgi:hypothetical protein
MLHHRRCQQLPSSAAMAGLFPNDEAMVYLPPVCLTDVVLSPTNTRNGHSHIGGDVLTA